MGEDFEGVSAVVVIVLAVLAGVSVLLVAALGVVRLRRRVQGLSTTSTTTGYGAGALVLEATRWDPDERRPLEDCLVVVTERGIAQWSPGSPSHLVVGYRWDEIVGWTERPGVGRSIRDQAVSIVFSDGVRLHYVMAMLPDNLWGTVIQRRRPDDA